MKTRLKTWIIPALLLCTINAFSQTTDVVLLFDQFASARWQNDATNLETNFKNLGITSTTLVAHSDLEKQIAQAKEAINNGAKALIIVAVDGTKLNDVVELAYSKGVKVIAYARPIFNKKVDLYLDYDNALIGELQAINLVRHVPSGRIIMINGPTRDYNAVLFRKSHLAVLKPLQKNGKIEVVDDLVMDSWNQLTALMSLHEKGYDLSKIDGILAASDNFADAVLEYSSDPDLLKKIYITGQDPSQATIQRIKNGTQSMTVLKPTAPLARKTALITRDLINGKKLTGTSTFDVNGITVNAYLFDPIVINQDNVDDLEVLVK